MEVSLNTYNHHDKITAEVRAFSDFCVLTFTNTISGTTRETRFDMFLTKDCETGMIDLAAQFNKIMGAAPMAPEPPELQEIF